MALDGVVGAVRAVWLRWERVKFYFLIRRQAERKEWGEVAGNRLLGLTLNCYTVCGAGEEKPSASNYLSGCSHRHETCMSVLCHSTAIAHSSNAVMICGRLRSSQSIF